MLSAMVVWSRAVIGGGGRCVDCGAEGDLHAHRVDKGKPLEVGNGVVLCGKCLKVRYKKRERVRFRGDPGRMKLWARIEELEAEIEELKGRRDRFPNPWPME